MSNYSLNFYWRLEQSILLEGLHGQNDLKKDYGSKWDDLFAREWKMNTPFVIVLNTKIKQERDESNKKMKQESVEDEQIKQETDSEGEGPICKKMRTAATDETNEERGENSWHSIDQMIT